MPVEKWSPFREFLTMQNELDRTFRRVLGVPRHPSAAWTPAMESFARDNDVVVKLEVPGIDPNEVEISVKDHTLTVSGERRQHEKFSDQDCYTEEFSYGSFERTLALPKEVEAENIKAVYENGVLEITVPQAAVSKEAFKVPVEIKK